MPRTHLLSLCCLLTVVYIHGPVRAVGTSYWTQTTEADFKGGTLENVVATNLGDLKLSRAIKTLLEENPKVSAVYALAEAADGAIYAGTGPNGVLLRIKDEKVSTVATLDGVAVVSSILIDKDGSVIVGTAGEAGRVLRINKPGEKPKVLFEAEGVQYIWALAQTPDGNLYAATGPNGQLFEIHPDGTQRALLETGESNLLSMVSDGKDLLFLGTDPHGLVYRVNRKTGESFVLYNCAESEVSALALDKAGNLYAGTSEAKEEPAPAAEVPGTEEKAGRPENGATGVPIPTEKPKEPAPSEPPNPNPGQPDPIPKVRRTGLHAQTLLDRRTMVMMSGIKRPSHGDQTSGRHGPLGESSKLIRSADPTRIAHGYFERGLGSLVGWAYSPTDRATSPSEDGGRVRPTYKTSYVQQASGSLSPVLRGEGWGEGPCVGEFSSPTQFVVPPLAAQRDLRILVGWAYSPTECVAPSSEDGGRVRPPYETEHRGDGTGREGVLATYPRTAGATVRFASATPEDGADGPGPGEPGKKKHAKPDPGKPNPPPTPPADPTKPDQTQPTPPAAHQPPVNTTGGTEARPEGNAIYKIDPEGFVTEVFRQPVLILAIIESKGTLLVAAGGTDGQVYQVRPADEETIVLAKVDAKQIMCLLSGHDGKIYLGTANVGTVASMSPGFDSHGTFASSVLDATQIARFGKIHLHGTLPANTTLTLATRSGNVKEPDEKTWSKWSDEAPASEFNPAGAPSARFLQYRLTFSSADGTATPVVRDVSVAYQVPNLPPQIKSIKIGNGTNPDATAVDKLIAAAGGGEADAGATRVESGRQQKIAWEASDPNSDALTYSLYLRAVGGQEWILLKDKLTDATYDWDTRTVADGRYEIKVVASDAAANPPGMGKTATRVSDPMTVDNTPPIIGDVKCVQRGADLHIDLKVVDRTSTVAALDYSLDSNKDWQFVLPVDGIYDSPEETVSFTLQNPKPGPHQIALRATDSKGNQSFENIVITVQSPAAAK